MQAYLTDVWKMSFTHAAATINVLTGAVAILPIGMAFLADKIIGHYLMLQLSSVAYCVGFGFLAMSTPPVLGKATGTCTEYEPACIGKVQSVLFYTALSLIAVGMSGHSSSLELTIERRTTQADEKENCSLSTFCLFLGKCVVSILLLVGVDTIPFLKSWAVRFGIPAAVTLVVTLFFFSESCCYTPPTTPARDDPRGSDFRLPGKCMILLSMTFMVCGLVMSIGNTYFVEQANHMNRKLGPVTVPLQIFLLYCDMQRWETIIFFKCLSDNILLKILSISNGMLCAILCCITAAKVEARRIDVIKKHGLVDKPDDTIPMSMFWLLPQFLFLSGLDDSVRIGIEGFFGHQLPDSMKAYKALFTEGVLGSGTIASVLSIYLSGKVSGQGGRPSWFQNTLNKSRLYNYYWTLAVISSVNFVLNFFFTSIYISTNKLL